MKLASYGGGSYAITPIAGRQTPAGAGAAGGGGFIVGDNRAGNAQCPPGYTTVRRGRGVNRTITCVPRPSPPPPRPQPQPAPVIDTRINVNPAMQQSFTPQFSPTMQQQQDSPGASQGASPQQNATVPQSTAPSGEADSTTALREELEQLRLERMLSRFIPQPQIIYAQPSIPRSPPPPQAEDRSDEPLPAMPQVPTAFPGGVTGDRQYYERAYNAQVGLERPPAPAPAPVLSKDNTMLVAAGIAGISLLILAVTPKRKNR